MSFKHCSPLLGRAAGDPGAAGRGTGRTWYRREQPMEEESPSGLQTNLWGGLSGASASLQ